MVVKSGHGWPIKNGFIFVPCRVKREHGHNEHFKAPNPWMLKKIGFLGQTVRATPGKHEGESLEIGIQRLGVLQWSAFPLFHADKLQRNPAFIASVRMEGAVQLASQGFEPDFRKRKFSNAWQRFGRNCPRRCQKTSNACGGLETKCAAMHHDMVRKGLPAKPAPDLTLP